MRPSMDGIVYGSAGIFGAGPGFLVIYITPCFYFSAGYYIDG